MTFILQQLTLMRARPRKVSPLTLCSASLPIPASTLLLTHKSERGMFNNSTFYHCTPYIVKEACLITQPLSFLSPYILHTKSQAN